MLQCQVWGSPSCGVGHLLELVVHRLKIGLLGNLSLQVQIVPVVTGLINTVARAVALIAIQAAIDLVYLLCVILSHKGLVDCEHLGLWHSRRTLV